MFNTLSILTKFSHACNNVSIIGNRKLCNYVFSPNETAKLMITV
jgi:hypothetical protein